MRTSLSRFAALATFIAAVVPSLAWAGEDWNTDYDAALKTAAADDEMVLLNFTGSDWCPPCKMLHSEILTQEAFKEYADENLVLVELDYPNSKAQSDELKKQNQELAETYGVEGYPTLVVLDSDGKEVKREVGLAWRTPEELISWISES
ncbi:MAG: thioredoxin family protein [Chthoniobacterales bacterium]